MRHLDEGWGLRGVRVKGGKTQDAPLPAAVRPGLGVTLDEPRLATLRID